jgi:hypothetical protein
MVGWVFFRAESFPAAFAVLRAMVAGGPGPAPALAWPLIPLAAALAIGIAQERGAQWSWRRIPVALQVGAATAMLLVLELCSSPGQTSQFIYFRF